MISKLREKICNVAKREEGFTLIELMVVIAVLGILAGIAIPRITGVQGDAKQVALEASGNTIKNTMEMYYAQNGKYPDFSSVSSDLAGINSALGSSFDLSVSNVTVTNLGDNSDDQSQFSITLQNKDGDYKITITQDGITGPIEL